MSIFSELLPKINEISKAYTKNFNDDLKVVFECFDKFEEEFQNGRSRAREKAPKDKLGMTTLQSINEDEGETNKQSDGDAKRKSNDVTNTRSSSDSNPERRSKKRSKNEMDDISSPEQDKRQKRNASVKAQSIISKQVNVNLTQKLRRENSTDKANTTESRESTRSRRRKEDDKENAEPNTTVDVVQIKQEKVSIPPEPMETESLPINVEVKQEISKDDIAMPPPVAPVPKPRKAVPTSKSDDSTEEESSNKRRTTRTKKQTDVMPPPPVPSARSTRASSRARPTEVEDQPPPETRPKRTRGRKKVSEVTSSETEKESIQSSQENVSAVSSPADKPRPKRTRRAQKAIEKEELLKKQEEQAKNAEPTITPKEERISQPEVSSPILQKETKLPKSKTKDITTIEIEASIHENEKLTSKSNEKLTSKSNEKLTSKNNGKLTSKDHDKMASKTLEIESILQDKVDSALDETRIIAKANMDQTVVIPNGVYNHAPVTPKNVHTMNETVVLEASNPETIVSNKQQNAIMDATVVIEKCPIPSNVTEDNSLLTDDSEEESYTPPRKGVPELQPTSAVKEKVQQFEEMASRVTRTKTRAMNKKDEPAETQTPPDKVSKPILSAETLTKMNSLIFNGKAPQISSSASKPRANIPPAKSFVPSSTSKLSAINKAKEAAEESLKREDARRKKEALLDAKREMQKRKREEKMAAAAAAREAAEKERAAAAALAASQRRDKQAHADKGKMERVREAERKKQELARKVAETEERRRAEETARAQRLADEQRRAEAQRRKQVEEQEAMKKEAAIMAKEIEKRQKEYIEKQKMKQRMEEKIQTPLRSAACHAMEPVYMQDGFQYLNSDEDEEPPPRPIPEWSTSKSRKLQLDIQCQLPTVHVDRLFSVRVHCPDLRDIFPNIERARLKRTSSAVWRTPPRPHAQQ